MPLTRPAVAWLLLAALFTSTTWAQKMAPGLWEHQTTMKVAGGQAEAGMAKMQQEMAKMPPEQRKMMEEMMAKRGLGIGAGAKPNSVRVCVTKEQAERDELPQQGDGRCKRDSLQRSGGTIKFKYVCSGEPPSSGEGEFTVSSNKAYSGHTVTSTVIRGKPEQVEMQMSGQWIAADCGDVAPVRR